MFNSRGHREKKIVQSALRLPYGESGRHVLTAVHLPEELHEAFDTSLGERAGPPRRIRWFKVDVARDRTNFTVFGIPVLVEDAGSQNLMLPVKQLVCFGEPDYTIFGESGLVIPTEGNFNMLNGHRVGEPELDLAAGLVDVTHFHAEPRQ